MILHENVSTQPTMDLNENIAESQFLKANVTQY